MSLPSNLNDEANSQTSSLVSTAESVNYIELLVRKLLDGDFLNLCPNLLRHWVVVVLVLLRSPPYVVVALVVVNDVLVLRRTTGEDTSHHVHCTKFSLLTLLVTFESRIDFSLVKLLVRRIVRNHCATSDAILCQI